MALHKYNIYDILIDEDGISYEIVDRYISHVTGQDYCVLIRDNDTDDLIGYADMTEEELDNTNLME